MVVGGSGTLVFIDNVTESEASIAWSELVERKLQTKTHKRRATGTAVKAWQSTKRTPSICWQTSRVFYQALEISIFCHFICLITFERLKRRDGLQRNALASRTEAKLEKCQSKYFWTQLSLQHLDSWHCFYFSLTWSGCSCRCHGNMFISVSVWSSPGMRLLLQWLQHHVSQHSLCRRPFRSRFITFFRQLLWKKIDVEVGGRMNFNPDQWDMKLCPTCQTW